MAAAMSASARSACLSSTCLSPPSSRGADAAPWTSRVDVPHPCRGRNRFVPRAAASGDAPGVSLVAEPLTKEAFAPFGQIARAEEDGVAFGPDDAALDLSQGTPRFYIMRLRDKTMSFDTITFHAQVTQCLGALGDQPWYMAVSAPTKDVGKFPRREDLKVFKIPPGVFVKMHAATWHAGPLWDAANGPGSMDFYNLELSDTNQVDHNCHSYDVPFEVVDEE